MLGPRETTDHLSAYLLAAMSLLSVVLVRCDQQQHQQQQHQQQQQQQQQHLATELFHRKYLNVKCDWSITGGGCYLRESYCNHNVCVCKPDFPINIADRMCVARFKTLDEECAYSQECQPGSYCAVMVDSIRRSCQCKTGYVYSGKHRHCIKGMIGSACKLDTDCDRENLFCDRLGGTCQCNYGYQWDGGDEACYKRSKYGEACEHSINCKLHDEFSDCDAASRVCICGQFLSRKYALDEVTNKCIACPSDRYQNKTNSCIPEKMTVSYGEHKRQYVYIIFCMSPFVVVIIIGFIYGYFNPNHSSSSGFNQHAEVGSVFYIESPNFTRMNLQTNVLMEYCLQQNAVVTAAAAAAAAGDTLPADSSHFNLGLIATVPPPAYESSDDNSPQQDLPPPYEEAIQQNV